MKRLPWMLCLIALSAFAEEPAVGDPQSPADWDKLRVQAKEMRTQSKQLSDAAEKTFAEANAACWKKFLVSSCQEEARNVKREGEKEARRLNVEAGRIERRLTAHERMERFARRAAEEPQRAADAARIAGEIRQHEEAALKRQAEKQAEIERRQTQGN